MCVYPNPIFPNHSTLTNDPFLFIAGYKNGLQTRKFLRLAVALSIVVVITTFYLLGDLTTDGYLFVIRHMEASGAGDGC